MDSPLMVTVDEVALGRQNALAVIDQGKSSKNYCSGFMFVPLITV